MDRRRDRMRRHLGWGLPASPRQQAACFGVSYLVAKVITTLIFGADAPFWPEIAVFVPIVALGQFLVAGIVEVWRRSGRPRPRSRSTPNRPAASADLGSRRPIRPTPRPPVHP